MTDQEIKDLIGKEVLVCGKWEKVVGVVAPTYNEYFWNILLSGHGTARENWTSISMVEKVRKPLCIEEIVDELRKFGGVKVGDKSLFFTYKNSFQFEELQLTSGQAKTFLSILQDMDNDEVR